MKTRFLFLLALLFAAAVVAGPEASALPDEGNRGYAVPYGFSQQDNKCPGELEMPSAVSGGFANFINKSCQRKDYKTNPKSGSQPGSASAYNAPSHFEGTNQAIFPVYHTGRNAGSSLLHYIGRLNI